MKWLLFNWIWVVITFGTGQAFAHPSPLLNRIAQEINTELNGRQLRGRRLAYSVSVGTASVRITANSGDSTDIPLLERVLTRHMDSLEAGRDYNIVIYFDAYSANVYASFYKRMVYEGLPNYDNHFARPAGGPQQLLPAIFNDLNAHRNQLDAVPFTEWHNGITWLVDSAATAELVGNSLLNRFLDSAMKIRWYPGMHTARPVKTMLKVRLNKADFLAGNLTDDVWRTDKNIVSSFVLPDKYGNRWVRFEKDRSKVYGNVVVSFVFNPVTGCLENPMIHQGKVGEATEFLHWLDKQRWDPHQFYWEDHPYAQRSYFCID